MTDSSFTFLPRKYLPSELELIVFLYANTTIGSINFLNERCDFRE